VGWPQLRDSFCKKPVRTSKLRRTTALHQHSVWKKKQARTFSKIATLVASLTREFAAFILVQRRSLNLTPRRASTMFPFSGNRSIASVGENVLRSAAAIEQMSQDSRWRR